MTRPIALSVRVENIPDALKAERRWVVWKYDWQSKDGNRGRWAKVLCTPCTGRYAKTNDASTWTTFDEAVAVYRAGDYDGIGFCLGDGWSGIDIDGLTTGAAIDALRCYRETSPSGTGVKTIGRAARIGGEIKFTADAPALTVWTSGRFFAVTGHGSDDPRVDITDLIDELFPARARLAHSDPGSCLLQTGRRARHGTHHGRRRLSKAHRRRNRRAHSGVAAGQQVYQAGARRSLRLWKGSQPRRSGARVDSGLLVPGRLRPNRPSVPAIGTHARQVERLQLSPRHVAEGGARMSLIDGVWS